MQHRDSADLKIAPANEPVLEAVSREIGLVGGDRCAYGPSHRGFLPLALRLRARPGQRARQRPQPEAVPAGGSAWPLRVFRDRYRLAPAPRRHPGALRDRLLGAGVQRAGAAVRGPRSSRPRLGPGLDRRPLASARHHPCRLGATGGCERLAVAAGLRSPVLALLSVRRVERSGRRRNRAARWPALARATARFLPRLAALSPPPRARPRSRSASANALPPISRIRTCRPCWTVSPRAAWCGQAQRALLGWVQELPLADPQARELLVALTRDYYRIRFDPRPAPAAVHAAVEAHARRLLVLLS